MGCNNKGGPCAKGGTCGGAEAPPCRGDGTGRTNSTDKTGAGGGDSAPGGDAVGAGASGGKWTYVWPALEAELCKVLGVRPDTEIYRMFNRMRNEIICKLELGHRLYGDDGFDGPPSHTAKEIMEELVDINGWSVLLWNKMYHLIHKLEQLEDVAGVER